MVMYPVHHVWPKPSCKAQWKGEEDEADRGRGGKTTSGNGQAWSPPSPRGQWRKGKNGGNWLQNHLWCPNNPHSKGIDDDDDENVCTVKWFKCFSDYVLSELRKKKYVLVTIIHVTSKTRCWCTCSMRVFSRVSWSWKGRSWCLCRMAIYFLFLLGVMITLVSH